MKMTVQWWELPLGMLVIVGGGAILLWIIDIRFKKYIKKQGE
jgi:hypothetical protein